MVFEFPDSLIAFYLRRRSFSYLHKSHLSRPQSSPLRLWPSSVDLLFRSPFIILFCIFRKYLPVVCSVLSEARNLASGLLTNSALQPNHTARKLKLRSRGWFLVSIFSSTQRMHPPLVSPFFVIILTGTWTAALRGPHLMTSNAEHGLCCSCFVHQLSSCCLIVVLLYLCCLEIPESNFIYTPAVFACGSAFRRSSPYVGCCASVHRRGILKLFKVQPWL